MIKLWIFCISLAVFVTLSPVDYRLGCFAQTQPERQSNKRIDEFGNITCEDELARLDNFSVYLENNPTYQGYIIVYGGRRGKRNEAKARAARMRYWLTRMRRLPARRIITIDGGYREEQTSELWMSPPGDPAPAPTPTVKVEEVRFKGRVKIRGYSCGEGLG
jgi:hypothetical protein